MIEFGYGSDVSLLNIIVKKVMIGDFICGYDFFEIFIVFLFGVYCSNVYIFGLIVDLWYEGVGRRWLVFEWVKMVDW